MYRQLDLTEFPLAEVSLNVIEILNRRIANRIFNVLNPFVPFVLVSTVEHADFVNRKYNFERIQCGGGALKLFIFFALNKYSDK